MSAKGAPAEQEQDANADFMYSGTVLFLYPQWADNPPYSLQLDAVSLTSNLPEQLSLLPSYASDLFTFFI